MQDNGIEDILIGESYKSTKKKGKGPFIFILLVILGIGAFAGWYFYTNTEIVNEKTQFTNSLYNRMKLKTNGNIYNGYGPTEITACCSIKKVENAEDINIGKPVINSQIYILDLRYLLLI